MSMTRIVSLLPQVELLSHEESHRATNTWIKNQNWAKFAEDIRLLEQTLMKKEASITASQNVANQVRQGQGH